MAGIDQQFEVGAVKGGEAMKDILQLPDDVLLPIMSQLGCRHLAKTACSCRRFRDMQGVLKGMPAFASSIVRSRATKTAVAMATEAAMARMPACIDFAIVCHSKGKLTQKTLKILVDRLPPKTCVIGCTSDAIMGADPTGAVPGAAVEPAIENTHTASVLLGRLPDSHVHVFAAEDAPPHTYDETCADIPLDLQGFKEWMGIESETTRFLCKAGSGKLTPRLMLLFCKHAAVTSLHLPALVTRSADAAYPGLVVTGGVGGHGSALIYDNGDGVSSITDVAGKKPKKGSGSAPGQYQAKWAGLVISSISPAEPNEASPVMATPSTSAAATPAGEGHPSCAPRAPLSISTGLRNADMIDVLRGAVPLREERWVRRTALPNLARQDLSIMAAAAAAAGISRNPTMDGPVTAQGRRDPNFSFEPVSAPLSQAFSVPAAGQTTIRGPQSEASLTAGQGITGLNFLQQATSADEAGMVPDLASAMSDLPMRTTPEPGAAAAEGSDDCVVPDVNCAFKDEILGPVPPQSSSEAPLGTVQANVDWTNSSWTPEATRTGASGSPGPLQPPTPDYPAGVGGPPPLPAPQAALRSRASDGHTLGLQNPNLGRVRATRAGKKRARTGTAAEGTGPAGVKRPRCSRQVGDWSCSQKDGLALGSALRLQVDSASVWGLEGGSQVWKGLDVSVMESDASPLEQGEMRIAINGCANGGSGPWQTVKDGPIVFSWVGLWCRPAGSPDRDNNFTSMLAAKQPVAIGWIQIESDDTEPPLKVLVRARDVGAMRKVLEGAASGSICCQLLQVSAEGTSRNMSHVLGSLASRNSTFQPPPWAWPPAGTTASTVGTSALVVVMCTERGSNGEPLAVARGFPGVPMVGLSCDGEFGPPGAWGQAGTSWHEPGCPGPGIDDGGVCRHASHMEVGMPGYSGSGLQAFTTVITSLAAAPVRRG